LSLPDTFQMNIRQMPTISPRDGLPMLVGERALPARTELAAAA
jgi:hypothetical protein